jgi:hypothetical protein
MNGVATTGPQDAGGKEVSAEGDNNGSEERTPSGASPTSCARPGGDPGAGSTEITRRRRGILLGTRAGDEVPSAEDDEKSLAWMANQAVKALNAVKASQMEQAQALKARGEIAGDEGAAEPEEEVISHAPVEAPTPEEQLAAMRALNAEEVSAEAASLSVQSGMAAIAPLPATPPPVQTATVGEPGAVPVAPPVEPHPRADRPPAADRPAAASRLPARPILIVGVLLMFGYAAYHHWFARNHAPGEPSTPPPAVGEPSGPELGRELAPPAISVVPGPESPGRGAEPAGGAAGPARGQAPNVSAPAAAATPTGTVAPAGAAGSSPPAAVHLAPVPALQPGHPASVPPGEPARAAGQGGSPPSYAPPVAAPPAVEAPQAPAMRAEPVPAPQTWHPAAAPAAEPAAATPRPAPPPAPSGRPETTAPPVVPKAPAARPPYPSGGYGYYPPPSSWQPYYRPGYPQTPARR